MITPLIEGKVICIICFHLFAPSIIEASYRFGSIVLKDARYKIVPHPDSFHISEITNGSEMRSLQKVYRCNPSIL